MNLLRNVLFLAADTTRSSAYAQGLAAAGLAPEHYLLLTPSGRKPGMADKTPPKSVGFPASVKPVDGSVECLDVMEAAGWTGRSIARDSVNDEAVQCAIEDVGPQLVIYSGFGGQLVHTRTLQTAPAFLHIHSGWLPDYRGSTTLYYAILEGNKCGVSAILLNEKIDQGPVIARRYYDWQAPASDIDHLYDGAIRADLLIRVMRSWLKDESLKPELTQRSTDGRTFYVIHPVLKHLALQRIDVDRHS